MEGRSVVVRESDSLKGAKEPQSSGNISKKC